MPTNRERQYYRMGFNDGIKYSAVSRQGLPRDQYDLEPEALYDQLSGTENLLPTPSRIYGRKKPKRKLSDWQKYIKNKRNHIKYRDGKLNLKKMGVEFRRKKRR
jgi:hypothetical protein